LAPKRLLRQRQRCQYLYFCTSKASKLSTRALFGDCGSGSGARRAQLERLDIGSHVSVCSFSTSTASKAAAAAAVPGMRSWSGSISAHMSVFVLLVLVQQVKLRLRQRCPACAAGAARHRLRCQFFCTFCTSKASKVSTSISASEVARRSASCTRTASKLSTSILLLY
jgi:hypothetical protein